MDRIVAMIKWGETYPAHEFNRLARAVRANGGDEIRIVCVTDSTRGLQREIETVPLPKIPLDRHLWHRGMWPKLALFSTGVFPAGAKVLYTDADNAIVGDIAGFFDIETGGGFHVVRDWKTYHERWFPFLFKVQRGANTSAFLFEAGSQTHIWARFLEDPTKAFEMHGLEQRFVTEHARGLTWLPDGWVESFKKCTAPLPPVSYFSPCRPGHGCRIVAFHGRPKIEELLVRRGNLLKPFTEGFGYVPWLERYCRKFGDDETHPNTSTSAW